VDVDGKAVKKLGGELSNDKRGVIAERMVCSVV